MAITITTTPATDVAAFAPVILAGTTSRNPFLSGVLESQSISAISISAGEMQITTGTTHHNEVYDTVVIDGCTGEYSRYNGRYNVSTVDSGTIFNVGTTLTAGASGTYGTVTRLNDALNIKVEVKNASSTIIATLYANVNTATGAFSLDVSKALQYELSSVFSHTAGEVDTSNAVHTYTLTLSEIFQKADYTTETSAHGTVPTVIAHMTTDLKTAFTSGTELLQGNGYHDGKIFIHFLMDTGGATVELIFTPDVGSATSTGALTEHDWHYGYCYEVPAGANVVKVAAWDIVDTTKLTDDIYIKRIGCASTILYFLNRYGGYEGYEFHDWDDEQNATKIDVYTGDSYREQQLFGKEYQRDEVVNVRDLVTSREVYDEDLTQVYITSSKLTYRAQDVEPEVTIKYEETFI